MQVAKTIVSDEKDFLDLYKETKKVPARRQINNERK